MEAIVLNLNELTVFLAVADTNSFSAAGREIHLTQPAVSQKIDNLEKHFSTRLFHREGRTVRLTEAGQALQPLARELVGGAIRLEETMASLHGEVIGEMNIGCSTASGKYLLPGIVAQYRRNFPHVRINILISSRQSVVDKLLSGVASLGVTSKIIEHRDLEYRDFYCDEVILIVPADHAWARYRQIYPDDLLDEPMILREEVAGTREVLVEGLQRHDISPDMLNIAMVLGNAEAIVMAVGEGIGVAFVSRLAALRDLELGNVVEVEVSGMSLKRNLFMVRNRRLPATRAQVEFWNFVSATHPVAVPE
jgi:DNA-binding transcriptional LysR family regulator